MRGLSQKGSSGWRGSSSGPCRGWQRGKTARGRSCIRQRFSGFVGEVCRVGEGLIIEQGRVGGMKSRGIRGVVSWCPLRSGEHSATANRVEQQLASRYRDHVRSK